jgi:hypothetical protein
MPSEADIRACCTLTNAALQISDLTASLRNVSAAQLEWRRINSRRLQHRTGRVEAAARLIRGYDNSLVPGLMQARQYATAVLATCIEFVGSTEDLDAAVEERMSRQRAVVRRKSYHCHFILAEQALHTTVGDDATMADQLQTLLDYTHSPGIDLGIVPRSAQFSAPGVSFVMYDANEVLVETMSSSLSITPPSEIELYGKGFQRLTGQSRIGDRDSFQRGTQSCSSTRSRARLSIWSDQDRRPAVRNVSRADVPSSPTVRSDPDAAKVRSPGKPCTSTPGSANGSMASTAVQRDGYRLRMPAPTGLPLNHRPHQTPRHGYAYSVRAFRAAVPGDGCRYACSRIVQQRGPNVLQVHW